MLRYIILIPIDYYILPPKIPLSIQKVLPDRVGIYDDGGMHCLGCKFFCLNVFRSISVFKTFCSIMGYLLGGQKNLTMSTVV